MNIKWPEEKKFAFTIVDDTDRTTMENGPVVYDFLKSLGMRTTKTVWIYNGEERDDNRSIIGDTCETPEYLNWVQSLLKYGFEIGLHSMSWSNTKRDRIIRGLELYKTYFGDYPKLMAQHNDNVENESLYWGRKRLSFPTNILFDILMNIKPKATTSKIYSGDNTASQYFWGDVCKKEIKYVRNFVFADINTLKVCPEMPYHDGSKPYVNKWFASTEAPEVNSFNQVVSKENIERLEREGGCCIIYTHFGKDFVSGNKLNELFVDNMKYLSQKDGWFVTASELLDFLETKNKSQNISKTRRFVLEIKWLIHKIRVRGTS